VRDEKRFADNNWKPSKNDELKFEILSDRSYEPSIRQKLGKKLGIALTAHKSRR
jgi:hypothetical protein